MAKVVYNACYGGFGVSKAGVERYAEIKGITLYQERDERYPALGIATYWTVPPSERVEVLSEDAWHSASPEERHANKNAYLAQTIRPRDIPRADPALVQVIEELGAAASGKYANLQIAEVPSGSRYRIDEYDGAESVMTPEDYEWEVAP